MNRGFTLIELLAALLILSLLALMSHRGLSSVLETRSHLRQETATWQRLAAFYARFEQDLQGTERTPFWLGRPATAPGPRLEFNRTAMVDGVTAPRRVAYGLNEAREIELWLWQGIDVQAAAPPARHPVLGGVAKFEIEYLNAELAWVGTWSTSPQNPALPRAARLRVMLDSGEEIVRVFAVNG